MANNILKGIISVEAPNVAQTAAKVSQATDKMAKSIKSVSPASNQATQSLTNLGRVVQDAPFGFIGIANNINPLLESFQRLKVSTGTTGGALKALGSQLFGPAGLGIAVSVASSLLVVFGDRLFGAGKAAKEASDKTKSLADSVKSIFAETGKEAGQVTALVAVLKSETETRERRLSAIKELQKIAPDYFNNLKLEGTAVAGLDAAYQAYIKGLSTVITAKIKQTQLEGLITKQLELQGLTLTNSQKQLLAILKQTNDERRKSLNQEGVFNLDLSQKAAIKSGEELKTVQSDIAALVKEITELSRGVKLPELKTDKLAESLKKTKPLVLTPVVLELPELPVEISGTSINNANRIGAILGQEFINGFREGQEKTDFSLIDAVAEEKKIKSLQQGFIKIGEGIGQFVTPAIDAMVNAIGEGKNAFQALGQAVGQILLGVIKKLIQAAVLALIISAISGGSANAAKGGLSFAQAFKGAFGGFRAAGGPVAAGTGYVVGENGPEYFVPNTGGTIIPNGGGGSFAGAMGNGMGKVVFEIQGNKLVGVLANASRSQARLS